MSSRNRVEIALKKIDPNFITVKLGYNELGYNELGYNELGYNEHSVRTKKNNYLVGSGHFYDDFSRL
jgi:hypothetical protein